ncbi:hypothetical protein F183_A38860 [Bryobacterales bacterium F-183]|nr:hypothetical protein F183_A38860 [Bryobacterales bacterium F-183]
MAVLEGVDVLVADFQVLKVVIDAVDTLQPRFQVGEIEAGDLLFPFVGAVLPPIYGGDLSKVRAALFP